MPKADDLAALTFEQLLERLEALTGRMASGEVGIEEAADLYEEAGRVYAAARDRLDAVQQRIERLRTADQTGPADQPGPADGPGPATD